MTESGGATLEATRSQSPVSDAERSTSPPPPAHPRSEPRKRRAWLGQLDPVLTAEILHAGTLRCAELVVLAQRPLKSRATPATVEEWWEYAYRRSWIEEHTSGRCRVTDRGREELEKLRQSTAAPDPAEMARALLRWLAPAVAVVVTAYLSNKHQEAAATILVIGIVVAVMLFIAAPFARLFDAPLDRSVARRACRWLEDEPVLFGARVEPGKRADRAYPPGEMSAPGL